MRTFVWLLQFKFERVICCAFSSEFNNIIMYNIDFVLRLTLNLFRFGKEFGRERKFTEVNDRKAFLRRKNNFNAHFWEKKVKQQIDLLEIQDVNYLELTNSNFLNCQLIWCCSMNWVNCQNENRKNRVFLGNIRRNLRYHFLRWQYLKRDEHKLTYDKKKCPIYFNQITDVL